MTLFLLQFPQELVTYGGNGQVFSNWAQVCWTLWPGHTQAQDLPTTPSGQVGAQDSGLCLPVPKIPALGITGDADSLRVGVV